MFKFRQEHSSCVLIDATFVFPLRYSVVLVSKGAQGQREAEKRPNTPLTQASQLFSQRKHSDTSPPTTPDGRKRREELIVNLSTFLE